LELGEDGNRQEEDVEVEEDVLSKGKYTG